MRSIPQRDQVRAGVAQQLPGLPAEHAEWFTDLVHGSIVEHGGMNDAADEAAYAGMEKAVREGSESAILVLLGIFRSFNG